MEGLLQSRLTLDFEVMRRAAEVPTVGYVRAYASAADAQAGRTLTDEEGLRGLATIYDVGLAFAVPTSRRATTRKAVARLDLLAGSGYPNRTPLVRFVSSPTPWSPNIHQPTGVVCLGEYWRRQVLLVELVAHVMRIANYDLPQDRLAHYNPDAARWWRERKYRPFHEGLAYPTVPAEILQVRPRRPVLAARATRPPLLRAAAPARTVLQPRSSR